MSKFLKSLTLAVVSCALCASALAQQATPPVLRPSVSDTPPVSDNGTSFFGSLASRFSIYLADRPFFINEKDIDAIVGDPWTLEPSTAAKLRLLPARVRMRLYSVLTLNPDAYTMVAAAGSAASNGSGMVMRVDPDTTKKLLDGVLGAFTDQFRTEELIDLAVYFLSTTPFFPKTQEGWRTFEKGIIATDLLLAAAYIMTMASTNNGSFSASGWLVKLPGDKFRLGWYGGLSHLGFAWHPDIKGGAQLAGQLVDLRAGVVHHVNAASDAEVTAVEAEIREHWLQKFLEPLSKWQMSLHAGARYVSEHNDPRRDHSITVSADVLAKRPDIFGMRDLNLLLSGKFSTDFNHTTTVESMLGLEHGDLGISGAIGVSATRDDILGNSTKAGIFIDGSFDYDPQTREKELQRAASRLRDDVDYMDRLDNDYREAEKGLSLNQGIPRSPDTMKKDREILEHLRITETWIGKGIETLRRHLGEYLGLWHHVCPAHGWDGGKCREELGPLDEDYLRKARLWIKPKTPSDLMSPAGY